MRRVYLSVVAVVLLSLVRGYADGGAIIARQVIDDLELTVFASPSPLRAGPVDVSVLVQKSGESILDATVYLSWRSLSASSPEWLPPCCTMEAAAESIPALRAHSNNRLLYSAIIPMGTVGPSELVIRVFASEKEVLLSCGLAVERPLPPALAFWPWLAFPPIAIAGFALHQSLLKSRQRSALLDREGSSST
jgi:hypothetical protein